MDRTKILIIIAAMIFLAFRIFQKYIRKDKKSAGGSIKSLSDNRQAPQPIDDEYEPYAKR